MKTIGALLIAALAALSGCTAHTAKTEARVTAEYTPATGPTARAEFFTIFTR